MAKKKKVNKNFEKWFKTYRSVTEVENNNVDHWTYEDVEIAYVEGLKQGRANACTWLLRWVVPTFTSKKVRDFLTKRLTENKEHFERELRRRLEERGNRLDYEQGKHGRLNPKRS